MPLPITALYAGILGLLAIALGAGSGLIRSRTGVSLGAGNDNTEQLVAFRRHGNFTEWVPIALILIALLELNGAASLAVHVLGAALVLARIAHPVGLNRDGTSSPLRGLGAAGTALVVLVASVWGIVLALG